MAQTVGGTSWSLKNKILPKGVHSKKRLGTTVLVDVDADAIDIILKSV